MGGVQVQTPGTLVLMVVGVLSWFPLQGWSSVERIVSRLEEKVPELKFHSFTPERRTRLRLRPNPGQDSDSKPEVQNH